VAKTTVIYVKFLPDVPCQKLFKSANVSQSYSKSNTGTVFLRHCLVPFALSRPRDHKTHENENNLIRTRPLNLASRPCWPRKLNVPDFMTFTD